MDESNRHARPPRAVARRSTSDPTRTDPARTDPARTDPARIDRAHHRPRGRPRAAAAPRRRTLGDLQPLVRAGRFRIAPHAVRHAACEGFTERDIVGTVMHGRELMRYTEDERLLVLGWLPISARVRIPLHVVLEYRTPRWVDVVTAFIPEDPHRVISRGRLAERLRYDRAEPEVVRVGPGAAER